MEDILGIHENNSFDVGAGVVVGFFGLNVDVELGIGWIGVAHSVYIICYLIAIEYKKI